MSRQLLWLSSLLSLMILLVGVAPVSAHSNNDDWAKAQVRVAHFSPDAPNVDVYVNSDKVLSNVPFGAVSGYLTVPAGRYTFAIRPAGAAADSPPVFAASQRLMRGRAYTVAAVGTLATIKPKVYRDTVCAPDAGNAKVRILHAAPDVPPVDIAVKDGSVVIKNLKFSAASRYIEGPAGSGTIEVRAAGTNQVLLTFDATVAAGNIYTVAAIGLAGDGSVKLLPILDRTPDKARDCGHAW
jgi:hypothetical protein